MEIQLQRYFWAVLILIALAILMMWVAITKVLAHEWYPYECCGGIDCGPATMDTVAGATFYAGAGGIMGSPNPPFVSTVTVSLPEGKQTVVIPVDFPRRESKDGRLHACIVAGQLRCLFMPPGM